MHAGDGRPESSRCPSTLDHPRRVRGGLRPMLSSGPTPRTARSLHRPMAKRSRLAARPGQRRPLQRPATRPAGPADRPAGSVTREEEARAAELEAAILAEEQAAEEARRTPRARSPRPRLDRRPGRRRQLHLGAALGPGGRRVRLRQARHPADRDRRRFLIVILAILEVLVNGAAPLHPLIVTSLVPRRRAAEPAPGGSGRSFMIDRQGERHERVRRREPGHRRDRGPLRQLHRCPGRAGTRRGRGGVRDLAEAPGRRARRDRPPRGRAPSGTPKGAGGHHRPGDGQAVRRRASARSTSRRISPSTTRTRRT